MNTEIEKKGPGFCEEDTGKRISKSMRTHAPRLSAPKVAALIALMYFQLGRMNASKRRFVPLHRVVVFPNGLAAQYRTLRSLADDESNRSN